MRAPWRARYLGLFLSAWTPGLLSVHCASPSPLTFNESSPQLGSVQLISSTKKQTTRTSPRAGGALHQRAEAKVLGYTADKAEGIPVVPINMRATVILPYLVGRSGQRIASRPNISCYRYPVNAPALSLLAIPADLTTIAAGCGPQLGIDIDNSSRSADRGLLIFPASWEDPRSFEYSCSRESFEKHLQSQLKSISIPKVPRP